MTDKIKSFLENAKRVVIVTHARPDGDAIGSILSMRSYLHKKGISALGIIPNESGEFLKWLPGYRDLLDYTQKKKVIDREIRSSDAIICLDFNSLNRIETLGHPVKQSDSPKLMIDHHRDPDDFADLTWHDPGASSTCELVYDIIEQLGDEALIDRDMAACLYTGIMTDTGSFRFSNTSARVHAIVSRLLERKIDVAAIYDNIFHQFSENRLRFFGYCTSEKLQVFPEQRAALISVTQEEIRRFNIRAGDTDGLVNYPLTMNGVDFSTLIIDRVNLVKLSFRSKGDVNVEEFARKYFDGGGHFNASGGASLKSLDETVEKFTQLILKKESVSNKS